MNIQFKNLIVSIKNLLVKKEDEKIKANFGAIFLILLTSLLSVGIIPIILLVNFICIGIRCLLNAMYSEVEKLLTSETSFAKVIYILVLGAFVVFRYTIGAFNTFIYTLASSIWQLYSFIVSCIESNEKHKFYCPYKDVVVEYTTTAQKNTL